MIKKFSELMPGDHFLSMDKNGDRHCFEMVGRVDDGTIRTVKSDLTVAEYLFGRIWTVNNNPDKLIPVFARAE
jgi:hypothetical protein